MTRHWDTAGKKLMEGIGFHEKGDLKQAEKAYRQTLRLNPNNPDAFHLLGLVAHQSGKNETALEMISQAIAASPAIPDYHNSLGNVFRALGRLEEAGASYREALQLAPNMVQATSNMGLALHEQGKPAEALGYYRRALELDPSNAEIHNNLGAALLELGQPEEAVNHISEAVRQKPDYAAAHCNMGNALKSLGRNEEAAASYRKALQSRPDLAEAHDGLGLLQYQAELRDEALSSFSEVVRLKPGSASAWAKLAAVHSELGHTPDALECFDKAIALKPPNFTARLGHCISQLKVCYDSQEEILTSRARYRTELEEILRSLDSSDPATIIAEARAMGTITMQPFFLAYQGENDRDLQKLYGELVTRMLTASYPQWAGAPPMPSQSPGEPLRIGIVSGYFFRHSNWKIPIKGWVENLDRKRFELYGYYTGNVSDAETVAAKRSFKKFVEGTASLEGMCQTILSDRLHVLIIPEVGMDRMTARIAALRLAPIQCASWGHPNTTGYPTIDYYLSSDLMEPPDADQHYTERLVRLPNLSVYYTPLDTPQIPLTRARCCLQEDAVLYFCAQSLFKYLPQHDEVFPRIAREVGNCQFVFLSSPRFRDMNQRFAHRLKRAFDRFGLNIGKHVRILPQLNSGEYKAVNGLCDVFLDSLGWSGCNSSLEAIECNLPVVTMAGSLMRGRHSLALLEMMGMTETVAKTVDDYVRLAVRIGKDGGWRYRLARETAAQKHRLYYDTRSVEGLADFLETAVAQRR